MTSAHKNSSENKIQTLIKLNELTSNYKSHLSGDPGDIREYIAICDLHLRTVYTLTVAESNLSAGGNLKVSSMPGFGTMLALVTKYSALGKETERGDGAVILTALAKGFCEALRTFRIPKKYASFKNMRDQLSHGHTLPSDSDVINQMLEELKALEASLNQLISIALEGSKILASEKTTRITLGSTKIDLLHLWDVTSEGVLGIYSNFAGNEIHYIVSGGDSHFKNAGDCRGFTKFAIAEQKVILGDINRFRKDLLIDIAGFTEDYSLPNYYFGDDEYAGVILVPWIRSTSDDNVPRTDSFRVGPDNRREWYNTKSKAWVSYLEFLRDICSWPLLARRVKIGLEAFAKARNEEENSRLGGVQSNNIRGPSKLKEVHDDLNERSGRDAFELSPRVDQACTSAKPSTAVYFVVGQAGLGKTDLMLNSSIERARIIENKPDSGLPLYLFVSSTGKSLASLDEAVNSSLNITKLLSSQGARALCRNGLLVLFVDGFDELLGSSGYENALGSLEPWFQDLSGKGVLVASARSSYYLTQYRRSLASHKNLNVDHTLVEVQAWDKADASNYLNQRKVPTSVISSLTSRDWELLSVPFFSKAFAAWLEASSTANSAPKIFDIVTSQYLDREAKKLRDPLRGELLTKDELKALFSEVAEMMQLSQSREMDQNDLEFCAQIAVSSDDLEKDRPGLSRRLTSICGIGVSTDNSGKNQFSFAHEVLFDCFLSSAIQMKAKKILEVPPYISILNKSGINNAVFEWLFEYSSEITVLVRDIFSFNKVDTKIDSILSKNLGSLWTVALNHSHGIPPTNIASGLQLGKVDLSAEGWKHLEVKNCLIKELIISPQVSGKIKLDNSDVAYLCCETREKLRETVDGINTSNIMSILVGEEYGEDPARVRQIIKGCGIYYPESEVLNMEMLDATTYYLRRIDRRPDVPVITSRDGKTVEREDARLIWAQKYGDDTWLKFIHALEVNELARLDHITSSGKPKSRLVMNFSASSILSRADLPGIKEFWTHLEQNN